MTYQQNNPEVDKEKDAFVSDESLFPNDEMKSEKRVGNSVILSIALFLAIAYIVLILFFLFSLFNGSVGWWLFVLFGNPYY